MWSRWLASVCLAVFTASPAQVDRSPLLIDTHNDVPLRVIRGADIGPRSASGHTDLARLREGGVGAVFFSAYVAPGYVKQNRSANRGLEMIDTIRHDIVARHPEHFVLALTADDIEAARRQGKIAALIGVEGGHAIEDSLRLLRSFHALGARYLTLTHSNTNNWADSSGDINDPKVQHHNGLTDFGRQVIAEMNRLGMIVDISHVSDKTFLDVLEVSKAPVFASHSSCRALADDRRNMTDEMIRALAAKGGVIQINFNPGFLTKRKSPPANLEDVVAHIEHAVKVGGMDAVGIGSDFDGIDETPVGLEDVSKFPALTRALLARGYSPADIGKIYGGNTLRLMRAVEAAARR
ncbi:MAG: dipeptidase [Acidobacteriota bacterium]